jgi:hypothetical protein
MLVNRRTIRVKPGRTEELVALVKAEQVVDTERASVISTLRVYTPIFGQFDQVIFEWDYKSLADYEKQWAEWEAQPTTAGFMSKWLELVEPGMTNEMWTVEVV